MHKIYIFLSMNLKTKLMFLEAFIFLGWASILKEIPFHRVAPMLGEHLKETSFSSRNIDVRIVKSVSQSIQIMSRNTVWESKCLVKGIAALKMLERRNIESTIYLGTGKDNDGNLAAHAWVRCGPYFVTGADGMENYTVVSKFAKKCSYESSKGEGNG